MAILIWLEENSHTLSVALAKIPNRDNMSNLKISISAEQVGVSLENKTEWVDW